MRMFRAKVNAVAAVAVLMAAAGPVAWAAEPESTPPTTQPAAGATELGKLAASLKPGQWAKLDVKGLDGGKVWDVKNGSAMDYADKALWDPKQRKIFYIGAAHGGRPANAAFIAYDDASNTVSKLPFSEEWGKFPVTHSYNALAMVPETGILYYRRFGKKFMTAYDTRKGVWRQELAGHRVFSNSNDTRSSLAWFPEMGGLVIYNNATRHLYLYDPQSGKVREIEADLNSRAQNFGRYNPVHKVVLFGGDRDLWKLDADGKVTRCKDSPALFGVVHSVNAIDPATGNLLVLNGGDVFHQYDVAKDEWSEADAGDVPFKFRGHGVTATRVPNYGVIVYLVSTWKAKPSKGQGFYVYKHAEAGIRAPAKESR